MPKNNRHDAIHYAFFQLSVSHTSQCQTKRTLRQRNRIQVLGTKPQPPQRGTNKHISPIDDETYSMASKPIRRSVTGLTNKNASNSNLSSTGQPTSVSNGHPKQCVCKTCTCGRHRCTGRDHSNVTSVGGHATFEGTTENRSEFRAHTLPPRPPVPQFHPTYHFIVFM